MQSKRIAKLLALLMAAMLILSGCNLVKKDLAVDAATEIVKVGDTVYTKAQVQTAVNNYLNQMANYYSQYGYPFDPTSAANIKMAQEEVTAQMVRTAVVDQKAVELGASPLTEEEKAELDESWQQNYDLIKSVFFGDEATPTDMTQEEMDAQIENYISMYFGVTKEGLEQEKVTSKLKAIVTKDVVVTDEEIQADYDSKVESAKTSYESDLSSYGTAVMNGSTVYYRPAGYRMVKQILVKFTAEDQARIDQLNTLLSGANSDVASQTTELNNHGLGNAEELNALLDAMTVTVGEIDYTQETLTAPAVTTADPEGNAAFDALDDEVKEHLRALKTAKALQALYQTSLDTATQEAYAHIDARADEVVSKIAEGADWQALVDEYNEDDGMKAGAANAETGYPVCANMTGMDEPFVTAAMALEKIGDVSPKTAGMYGYYIVKYESDVAEGPVDLAEVKEGISSALLTTKQDEFYDQQVETWVSEAKPTIDMNALNN